MSADQDSTTTKPIAIYVALLDEGTDVCRTTLAEPVGSGLYRLLPTADYDPEDEIWEFPPGSIVRCEERQGREGTYLLAVAP